MPESLEHEGIWWDPSEPEKRVVGTFRFDKTDGTSLTLVSPADKPSTGLRNKSYNVLHGITAEGTLVTLFDCFETSRSSHLFAVAPEKTGIYANAALLGFHALSDDPAISTASVQLKHLAMWFGRSGMSNEPTENWHDMAMRYTSREPLVLWEGPNIRVTIRSFVRGSISTHEAHMKDCVALELSAARPRPLSEFQTFIQSFQDLLSIACADYCSIEALSVVPPMEPDGRPKMGSFLAIPIYKDTAKRNSLNHALFEFRDIEAHSKTFFDAWFSRMQDLQDARTLYMVGVYGSGYVEHRLLALSQAAEAYHRRFGRDRYVDQDLFEKDIHRPMVAAIPKGIDPDFRASLKARLRFANEYSLRRRLKDLFGSHADALTAINDEPADQVSAIVDTRNEFTHLPLPTAGEQSRPAVERVLGYTYLLRLLLEACFLSAAGLSATDISALAHRSESYRQWKRRFAELQDDL